MKRKLFSFWIPILLLNASFFPSCSNTQNSNTQKIASIYTHNYGVIKPLDIYLIKDGYITNYSEKVEATTLDKYFVKYYQESKQTASSSAYGISVTGLKFDILSWKYQYKDWESVYFHKSLQYSYTIHIDLVEKETSYQITYYHISDLKMNTPDATGYTRELCFNNPPSEELLQYKEMKEFPKSEIISIDYILTT